jgi:hypothetical protein
MRRALFIAGFVVATLLLAGLGAVISLFRSITSFNPSLSPERSTAR